MSEEGLFFEVHYVSFIPQIIKHTSVMEMEDAAGDGLDMLTIHSRAHTEAGQWTDGHMVNPG